MKDLATDLTFDRFFWLSLFLYLLATWLSRFSYQGRPNLLWPPSSSGKISGHKSTYMQTWQLVYDELYVFFM